MLTLFYVLRDLPRLAYALGFIKARDIQRFNQELRKGIRITKEHIENSQ